MWKLEGLNILKTKEIQEILKEGCEPFSVMENNYGEITIWFKRRLTKEEEEEKRTIWKEEEEAEKEDEMKKAEELRKAVNEIHNEPGHEGTGSSGKLPSKRKN